MTTHKLFYLLIYILVFLSPFLRLSNFPLAHAWEEYSLNDLYRIALERAERIRISEEDLYISETQRDKAMAALLPRLTAFSGYTRYSNDKYSSTGISSIVVQPVDALSWGLRLDQSISIGRREVTALRISKEGAEKSRHDLRAIKETYILSVANAYYEVLRAMKAVEIARANLQRLTKHRDAASIRLKVGEVTKTDLLRAEAELSGAQADLVRSENSLRLARAVLARIVGLDGDFGIKTEEKGEEIEITDLVRLKEIAFSERPELRSADLQKKISEEQIRYAKGAFWPTVSIEGVYLRREEDPESAFLIKETLYGGIRLNLPIFEGGLRRAEVREAEARYRQATLLYEDIKKTISIEVEEAFLDLQTQKGVLKSLEDQLRFARDNFNSISRQYEFGLANSIDVIDANTLLLTSERQLMNARYNYELSEVRLKKAAGLLLKCD
jgi:outer membrane protein